MKKIFTFLVAVFLLGIARAQYPLSDAITLKKNFIVRIGGKEVLDPTKVDQILQIFSKYVGPNDDPFDILTKNIFIKEFISTTLFKKQSTILSDSTVNAGGTKNFTTIAIDALARFIVERIKKELQAAFFEKLYVFIKDDKYKDCRTLFPNTYKTLLSLGDNIYNYETYLTSLRNAFGKDLEIILPNLETVIRSGQYAPFFTNHTELRSVCLTALFIAKGLKNGDHIGMILETFPATSTDYIPASGNNEENFSLMHTVQFVQELSKSLKSNAGDPDRYWADVATLKELNDETTLTLYLGLLYERVKIIPFGTAADETFGVLLTKAKDKFDQLRQLILLTTDNIKECERKLSELKTDNNNIEHIFNYINSISNLLNGIRNSQPFNDLVAIAVNPLPAPMQTKINNAWELLDKANFVIDNTINIYAHLKDKKYILVVSDLRNIYKERFAPDKINPGSNNEPKRIYAIIDFLLDYGSALAEMAEAKDSKDVYAAIDRIAAPVGSSRIKKESVFSLSLNAYGGGFIGKENIEGVTDNAKANNYGISAPVGLAISLGRIKKSRENITKGFKSLTLFISVIDIGAPVSFRFQNDKLDEIPAVEWKDIISPGAFLIYGFGKVPISFSFGYQTGPNLRKVSPELNEYANSRYGRLSVGLYVDIPVLMIARKKYW